MTRNRRHVLIIITISVAVTAVVGHGIYYWKKLEKENKILSTNKLGYAEFDIPHADSLIVGKWQNTGNPQWYKVYYDDFDEEQRMFWGKEWNESEDVTEEDLNYHGNGWFRWEKNGKALREYATMDARDIPALNTYMILSSSADSLVYREKEYKKIIYRFVKVK